MDDSKLPDEYVPVRLRPPANPPRTAVAYWVATETVGVSGLVFSTQYQPVHELERCLEHVPDDQGPRSVIVRMNVDGSDDVLYRWHKYRDGKPGRWVREGVARKAD